MKHRSEGGVGWGECPPTPRLETQTKARSKHKQGQRLLPDPGGADARACCSRSVLTCPSEQQTQARSHANKEAPRSAPVKARISKGSGGFYTAAVALF